MDKYWKSVIALTGLAGVGAFVFWSLNRGWLELGIFAKLTSEQTFILMLLFLALAFLGLLVLVGAHLKTYRQEVEVATEAPRQVLPQPIAAYIRDYPEFLQKADIDAQCVRTSKESFFSVAKNILAIVPAGGEVFSTDNLNVGRAYTTYWFGEGLHYLDLNFEAARRGVKVSRVFIVTKADFERHTNLLRELVSLQTLAGIRPYIAYYEELPDQCKREFVLFADKFVDEVHYDFRSEMVIDNYISWAPEKLEQFRVKMELIKSFIHSPPWEVTSVMATDFNVVKRYAQRVLQQQSETPGS